MHVLRTMLVFSRLFDRATARPPEGRPTGFRLDAKGAPPALRFSPAARTPFASIQRTPFASNS